MLLRTRFNVSHSGRVVIVCICTSTNNDGSTMEEDQDIKQSRGGGRLSQHSMADFPPRILKVRPTSERGTYSLAVPCQFRFELEGALGTAFKQESDDLPLCSDCLPSKESPALEQPSGTASRKRGKGKPSTSNQRRAKRTLRKKIEGRQTNFRIHEKYVAPAVPVKQPFNIATFPVSHGGFHGKKLNPTSLPERYMDKDELLRCGLKHVEWDGR
jgi:hypothetical protein